MQPKKLLSDRNRRLTIQSDDPFVEMFMNSEEREILKDQENAENIKRRQIFAYQKQVMLNSVKTDLAAKYQIKRGATTQGAFYWQTPGYYQLSENRRRAIDTAKLKSQHSDFWYQLQTLNDKISVFRGIYYHKLPQFDQHYYNRKQRRIQIAEELKISEEDESPTKVTSIYNSNRRGHSARVKSVHSSARTVPSVPSPVKIKKKEKPLSQFYVQRIKSHIPVPKKTQVKNANSIYVSQEFSTNSNSERVYSEKSVPGRKQVKIDMRHVKQIQEADETDEAPRATQINSIKSGRSSPQPNQQSHERLDCLKTSIGSNSGQAQSRNKIKISDLLHESLKDEPCINLNKQNNQINQRRIKLEKDRISQQIKDLEKRRHELSVSMNLNQILKKSQELIDQPIGHRIFESPSKKSKKPKHRKRNIQVIPDDCVNFHSHNTPYLVKDPTVKIYTQSIQQSKTPQLKKLYNNILSKNLSRNMNLKPYFSPDPKQLNTKSEQYKFWMLANSMKILKNQNSYPKKSKKHLKVTYAQHYNILQNQKQGILAIGHKRCNSSMV